MRTTRLWMAATAVILLVVAGLFIASCGNTTATTTSVPSTTPAPPTTATTAGPAMDSAALYSVECAGCHPSMPQAPGGANQVRGVITMGKGYMPSFTGTLTVDQILTLATWVNNGGQWTRRRSECPGAGTC